MSAFMTDFAVEIENKCHHSRRLFNSLKYNVLMIDIGNMVPEMNRV